MDILLLLHGALGSSAQLDPLKERLSDQYDVRSMEFDGHGKHAHLDVSFVIDHFVGQLGDYLEHLDGKVHVFGYSMGGFVALLQAARGGERISSVFTLGTKMKWNEEIAAKEASRLNPEKILEKVPGYARVLMDLHSEDHWQKVVKKTAVLLLDLGDKKPMTRELVSSISCPVHVCLGDQDEMVTPEESEKVVRDLSNGAFSRLENSKHPIERVDLQALADAYRSFLIGLS